MPTKSHVLAIDLGTSGPKVAVVREDGEIVSSAFREISTRLLPASGAEQDPEEIWRAVCEASAEAVAQCGAAAAGIRAIATTSQYFSIVPMRADGTPAMNLIVWMDRRGAPHTHRLYAEHPEALPLWIDTHGLMPLPSGVDSLSHMLWVRNERPEVYERTAKFVEPMDYLTWRFTGRCTASGCTAFPLLLTDNRDPERIAYADELIAAAGIEREKLPELVPANAIIGPVLPAVAAELGLDPQTVVLSGCNDTHAVSVAAGTFRDGCGGLNIGSTGQVLADAPAKKTDPANDLTTMPSPIAGRVNVMAEGGLAGKALDHFVRSVLFASDELGSPDGASAPFAGLDRALAAAPAGSGGVLFLPWLTGTGSPDANDTVRGAFVNLSLETGRREMVRAAVEGITMSLRRLLGAVEEFTGSRLEALHFSGGGARSEGWAQIAADVCGRPVLQLEDAHFAGCRGAAFLAFEQLGVVSLDRHETICRIRRELAPDAAKAELYDRQYESFLLALEQNKPLFARLNASS